MLWIVLLIAMPFIVLAFITCAVIGFGFCAAIAFGATTRAVRFGYQLSRAAFPQEQLKKKITATRRQASAKVKTARRRVATAVSPS